MFLANFCLRLGQFVGMWNSEQLEFACTTLWECKKRDCFEKVRNRPAISASQKCRLRKGQNRSEKLLVCTGQPPWRRQTARSNRTHPGEPPKATRMTHRRAVSSLGRAEKFGTP